MNVEFSTFVSSSNYTSKFEKIKQYIDTKNKFCSLFWGNAKYSKRDYNIDEKKLCIFFKNFEIRLLCPIINRKSPLCKALPHHLSFLL